MNKILVLIILVWNLGYAQEIAVAKYSGGGDWYANPTSLPNLAKFCNQNINTKINTKIATVEVGSSEIFTYPFVHMTGHGNVVFSPNDVINLRNYLTSGGFLHIDDNYGMDEFIRKEIKKIFPDNPLTEIPSNHIYFKNLLHFLADYQKFTNMTIKNHKLLGFSSKGELFFYILIKRI